MLGSNIARLLTEPYYKCDIREDGMDLCDAHYCRQVMRDVGTVYDCAAPTQGIGSDEFLNTARIPMNLLACLPAHYVYTSSSCIYPDNAPLPTHESWGFSGEPEAANRGYGWAKRAGELACEYSGVPCTIVRLSNIYGPSYDWAKPHKHVIPALIEKMRRGDDPLIAWGSGNQTRSFMYEEDCAKLIIALSSTKGTFNLGGEEVSIRELVRMLAEITGFKGQIVYDTAKPEGPTRKCQDTRKLDSVLWKWKPGLTALREGLEKTVASYDTFRNHRFSQSA